MSRTFQNLALEAVPAAPARHGLKLQFPDEIEEIYNRETVIDIRKNTAIQLAIGIILYDLFLISDYFVSPDNIFQFFVARILICTPICALSIFLILKDSRLYHYYTCIYPLSMTMVLSWLIVNTNGDFRANYLFGNVLLMICCPVMTRPHVPFVALTVSLQSVCYFLVLVMSDAVAAKSEPVSMLFCLSGAVLAIMTSFALELTSRRGFLLKLRVQILNRELEALARTDPLTGLGNRRAFAEDAGRYWGTAPADAPVSLILIDVDHFKKFNDTYGHQAGDACLEVLAGCVAKNVRIDRDLAIRFGGEELLVFLPDTDFTEARRIAEAIRKAIRTAAVPHPVLGPGSVVTASFGVATAPAGACSSAELVRQADTALYAAKANGRDQVWPPLGDLSPPPDLDKRAGVAKRAA